MDRIIKQAREYLGYTVDEVARVLGVAPADLVAIEAGEVAPDDASLARLSRLYRRTPDDLLKPGPDDVPPLPAGLESQARHLPIGDRMELAMFARFLRGGKTQS